MAERIIKIIIPQTHATQIHDFLQTMDVTLWQEENDDGHTVYSILSSLEQTEHLTDALQHRFGSLQDFRMIVIAVEATISNDQNSIGKTPAAARHSAEVLPLRISREELYSDVEDATRLSRIYLVMVALSTVVASIGLLKNNVAVIIGAMVIAPLLGPNVALALSTTLADQELGRKAIKTFVSGCALALLLSLLTGLTLPVDPAIEEIASRTQVGLTDVVLALAAGCAGVLAYTTGASSAVIGVMVAVALLPPLACSGLLLGSGNLLLGWNAFLLFACNVICVNLTGILTFFLQGVRPRHWWEANRAKRIIRTATVIWVLTLLASLLVISR